MENAQQKVNPLQYHDFIVLFFLNKVSDSKPFMIDRRVYNWIKSILYSSDVLLTVWISSFLNFKWFFGKLNI